MRVHVLQHVPFEGPGAIEPWLQRAGATVTFTRFFETPALPEVATVDRLVVMGGPMSVHDEAEFPWLRAEKAFLAQAIRRGAVVLGICLGAQLVAEVLGGTVSRNREREIGWFPVARAAEAAGWGRRFPDEFVAFHWHGETFSLPPGARHLLRSAACERQAFAFGPRVLGLQFHLETTEAGIRSLVAHGRADMAAGTFVQDERRMLAGLRHLPPAQAILDRVLTGLFAEAPA